MKRAEIIGVIGLFMILVLFAGSAEANISDHNSSECQGEDANVICFIGTLCEYHPSSGPGSPSYWMVKVDEVQVGSRCVTPYVNVTTSQATPPPWGTVEPGLKKMDRVWVFGAIEASDKITLHGSKDFYLERAPREIELVGTALDFHRQYGSGRACYWTVKVDHVICGPPLCCRVINVTMFASNPPKLWGFSDQRIKPRNKVTVFGTYHTDESVSSGKCKVSLFGSKKYFIKKKIKPTNLIVVC